MASAILFLAIRIGFDANQTTLTTAANWVTYLAFGLLTGLAMAQLLRQPRFPTANEIDNQLSDLNPDE